jgi:hypothetical protein
MDMKKLLESITDIDSKKEQVNEMASMNISMNADSADEVGRLLDIVKGAAGHDHMRMPAPSPDDMPDTEPMPLKGNRDMRSDMEDFSSIVNRAEQEQDALEDYENEPDEEYADTQTMTKDLSGGLNREKKAYKKAAGGDNPMALEDEIKARLWNALNEMKSQTCNECGKTMLTASEKKELAELEEGKRHGNSKIYDKCWKGCTKVAGKKRGEPGSCKCD